MQCASLNRAGYVILRYCDMLVVPVAECNRPIKKKYNPNQITEHLDVIGSHFQYQTLKSLETRDNVASHWLTKDKLACHWLTRCLRSRDSVRNHAERRDGISENGVS